MQVLIPGVMLKNLQVLRKIALFIFTAAALLSAVGVDGQTAEDIRWFRSNASGMALEYVPSRLAALRNEYSLSVQILPGNMVPQILLTYYEVIFTPELRILYENAAEIRRQWIFRDHNNNVRVNSSGKDGFFDNEREADNHVPGFIEIRNNSGQIIREIRFEDDVHNNSFIVWEFRFFYERNTLIYADTYYLVPEQEDFIHISRDYFFYNRSGSVRAIERSIFDIEADTETLRLAFPGLGTGIVPGRDEAIHGLVYTSRFLQNIDSHDTARISYTFDSRGRITGEIWYNDDDEVTGEFVNTWSSDRLESVLWVSSNDERSVLYEYDDSGDRIMERNYRRGVLERTVTYSGGREIEELYMNGRIVLRSIWEDGIRLLEERIPFSSGDLR